MSVVYVAYDPELNREVALKVMRPQGYEERSAASERLLREAQAMARLAHVNVVHVYDVGVVGGRVYMAMEYVRGATLAQWVGDGNRRSWTRVVDVLVRAGRGLAAAHAAGLVHLDFKPTNVLVGDDGEVRVVDFGLARPPRTRDSADRHSGDDIHRAYGLDSSAAQSPESSGRFDRLRDEITELGLVMGTPGYIAAEQLRGELADARADQFAFCSTAWITLYGERPFAGATPKLLNRAVKKGEVREPPSGTRVPSRFRKLLARGLRADPEERHASLGDLLDAMVLDRRRSQRRVVFGLGALLVVGIGGYALAPAKPTGVDCDAGQEVLAGVWDAPRRAEVQAAILEDPRPFAADVADAVTRSLDTWVEEWVQIRRDSCVATHITGEQSADLLDLRTRCLRRHLVAFEALTATLAVVDPTAVEHATAAASALAPLQACRDAKVLAEVIRPVPPELEARVEATYERLAVGGAMEAAGKYPLALVALSEVWLAAELLKYGPLVVDARRAIGSLLLELGKVDAATEMLLQAQYAAESEAMDTVRLSIAVDLLFVFAHHSGDLARAHRAVKQAYALLDRINLGPRWAVRVLQAEATLLGVQGRGAESVERFEEALRIHAQMESPSPAEVASAHMGLGAGYHLMASYDDALLHFGHALDLLSAKYGDRHPTTGAAHENIGTTYQAMGRYQDAKAEFLITRRINDEALIDDAGQATLMLGLSAAHDGLEEYDEAAAVLGRLVDVLQRRGRENVVLAAALGNLAGTELERGRYAAALAGYQKQIPMFIQTAGPDHVYTPYFQVGKARALLGLSRHAAALSVAAGVVQTYRDRAGQTDPLHRGEALLVLARALDGLERRGEPLPTDASALVQTQPTDRWLADARAALELSGPAAKRALKRYAKFAKAHAKRDSKRDSKNNSKNNHEKADQPQIP